MRNTGLRKLGYRGAGLVLLLVMVLLIALSVMVYRKAFDDAVMVTLKTDRLGNQLDADSEVKARGVVIGHVRDVEASHSGATITLALRESAVDRIPETTKALLLPKTLFGERYVRLTIPENSNAPPLSDGDVITQDHSENAIEMQQVFNDLLPLLRAVQPQKLATMLTSVANALEGRGEQIGDTLALAADYLRRFNPSLPRLTEDIRKLAKISKTYGDIAPELLDALADAAVTMNTVAEKRDELSALYARVTASSTDVATFLRNNKHNIIRLAAESREPLEIGAFYSPSFPCTLRAMVALKPAIDKVLGAGPRPDGMHLRGYVNPYVPGYEPGEDDPEYTASGPPRCYPSGLAPQQGIEPAPVSTGTEPTSIVLPSGEGLGLPNSPQERQLISNLVAAKIGMTPAEVPEWASVLVGPLYRGKEVTVR